MSDDDDSSDNDIDLLDAIKQDVKKRVERDKQENDDCDDCGFSK